MIKSSAWDEDPIATGEDRMEQETKVSTQDPKPPQKGPSKSAGLVIFRLLLTTITAVVLGGVIYFGTSGWIPFLDKNPFQSISDNQSQVQELRQTQKSLEEGISAISATLEANRSGEDGILSEYQATLTRIEVDLENLTENLESAQASIDTNTQINTYMSTVYPQRLFDIEKKQSSNSQFIEAIATAQMRSVGMDEDLALIRILEQLSRSNQFMLHSNYGLAEDTLIFAKDDLDQLLKTAPSS
jgi:hypothetical protein